MDPSASSSPPSAVCPPSGRNITECSGPHGGFPDGDRPLAPALESFARDGFPPCQSDPICAILESSGLVEVGLIMGIAAVSAEKLVSELRPYVRSTAAHFSETFELLIGPIRIVWAHARAAEAIRYLGDRRATSQPMLSETSTPTEVSPSS